MVSLLLKRLSGTTISGRKQEIFSCFFIRLRRSNATQSTFNTARSVPRCAKPGDLVEIGCRHPSN